MAVYSIIQQEPEGIPKPITQAASIVVQPESLKNFEYPGTRQGSGILPQSWGLTVRVVSEACSDLKV